LSLLIDPPTGGEMRNFLQLFKIVLLKDMFKGQS
jgi:hypothetical protein